MDPEAERRFKLSHSIDGSQFAQAPAATCTEAERTFADEVPSVCRVHIRQEILSADYEDDAAETTAVHRRRLEEQQPEAAKALRLQSEALQGLSAADLKAERAQSEEAEREEKADHVAQLQATVLAPIQEGMQSVPDSQVRNSGSDLLRKVNLLDFKAALKKRMLEESSGSTEASLQAAVTTMEKAKTANKQIQDQGTAFMEKFALDPMEISAWPTDLQQKLERGLFCPTASLGWHQVPDPSDMLQHYLPATRALQNGQNPWAERPKLLEEMPDLKHTVATAAPGEASTLGAPGLNEMDEEARKLAMLLWALKVHRGELRMFGGVWRLSSARPSRTGRSQNLVHSWPRRWTDTGHWRGSQNPHKASTADLPEV